MLVLADWVWRVGEVGSGEAEEGEAGRPGGTLLHFCIPILFWDFCALLFCICAFLYLGGGLGEAKVG